MPFSLFGKKPAPAPAVGKWVENVRYHDYGAGMQGETYLGTYHWEGPEPLNGIRPVNPAETPEGKARLEEIRTAAADEKKRNNAYAAAQQARWLEEKKAVRAKKLVECKAFVAQAEAEIASENPLTNEQYRMAALQQQRGGRKGTRRRRRFTARPGLTVRRRARKSKSRKA